MQVFKAAQGLQIFRIISPTCKPTVSLLRNLQTSSAEPETQFHEIKDTNSGKIRKIAYKKLIGPHHQGIFYVPGFMSNMAGAKSAALHSFCHENGFPYVRYDPSGLGKSEGIKMTETTMSLWLEDATEMLLKMTDGPQIVLASSMGCWITSLIAKNHPDKFAAIVMLAPAFNFGERYEKVLRGQLPPNALKKFEDGQIVKLFAPDYGEFPLSKKVFEDMKQYNVTMDTDNIPMPCPVRIIHSVKDKDVPHLESLPLLKALQTTDVELNYLKYGGHTLSDSACLKVMFDTVLNLVSSAN
ncbi:palmitoyl-protein thioesterase ABHD10, mitochondrial [Procambarus clarkii]|uniref:palmitoyl-protein thioesterase ABHD10, mitochondrial n=1 Tax=Procambarus clarkii TaxID=6728 RepID=UPI001E675482|nr:palmitoyl-protein thioesterase ABHD10, mitochondrial-like [Procambarus clarkii]XP_045596028.1 palmitoyl-protein thioesterase ABHD10, mitochondrial-like [Procambarus clarkii]